MASDFLLEIDGIKGESQDSKHKGTIELASFSWGVAQTGGHSAGGGGGAGKSHFQDLHCTASVNVSSPVLMLACASGEHIKKATLFVRKAGKDQHDYYKVEMSDLLISGYQSGGSHEVPTDQFSLNFAKITFQYQEQNEKGELSAKSAGGWDIKANKKA